MPATTEEITLYAFKGRSRAERVLWVLQELRLPHRVMRLDARRGENRSASYLSLSPDGKVPALLHGNRVLTESLAICLYLCSLVATPRLVPEEPEAAFAFFERLFFAVTEMEPYLWLSDQEIFLKRDGLPKGIAAYSAGRIENCIPRIHAWLESAPYVAGETFTLADILFYHLLSWAGLYDIPLTDTIRAYLKNLEQRPAFPATMGVPGSPATTG